MAVAENQLIQRQDRCRGNYPVGATENLFQGTLTFLNATGFAVAGIGGGNNQLGGVVVEQANNAGGADGDINVETYRRDNFTFRGQSGFTQADVGVLAYASDNYTITTTGAGNVLVGTIVRVNAAGTEVTVDLHYPTA